MALTPDQVLALAPDAASVTAGRAAANPRDWSELGHDTRALWGKCRGSALYVVMVDLSDNASKCSCPSRKFPCKPVIGLLLQHANGKLAEGAAPGHVTEWIGARDARVAKKADAAEKPFDPEAAWVREEKRLEGVQAGVTTMMRWLGDLARDGLATVEATPPWERQAARLVDAKAPGLASRVRALEESVHGDDWPARLAAFRPDLDPLSDTSPGSGRFPATFRPPDRHVPRIWPLSGQIGAPFPTRPPDMTGACSSPAGSVACFS